MTENNKKWLNHLTDSIPKEAYGYTVSMYSVALEGWRRGLDLRFRNLNKSKAQTIFYLSDGKKEHRFAVSRGDKVPKEAIQTCISKELTKKYLLEAGVPTPEGKTFNENHTNKDILEYANKLGYPLVIKPVDGTGGQGVIANIWNQSRFEEALNYVREELNFKRIIVEKHFNGIDVRAYVIDNKVIGAIKRERANVIGDGVSTIAELIKLKEDESLLNPSIYGRKIKIDNEMHNILEQQGFTLKSVPQKGEKVYLKTKNNVSVGGESIDITDELSEEIKQIAIDASNAIPGLVQCGVDLMVNLEENKANVIEINSRPHIRAHLFPKEGKARDIPKAIIDYYFPDTEPNHQKPFYYFDFQHVWECFQNGSVKEISIPKIPQGNLDIKKFIISGHLQNVNYGSWVRKKARDLNLNGFIEHLENGEVSIVVSGKKESLEEFKNIIQTNSSQNAKVTDVKEQEYDKPIKVGFVIKNEKMDKPLNNGYHPVRIEGLRKDLFPNNRKSSNKLPSSTKNVQTKYKKEYEKIINSTSWKITKPLRKLKKIFK